MNTFVRACHFLGFGGGIFYLAVVVEQECFLLLKKVIHLLCKQANSEKGNMATRLLLICDQTHIMRRSSSPLLQRSALHQLTSPCF